MNLIQNYLEGGKFSIWPEKYAILRTTVTYEKAFANIVTTKETTIIAKEHDATYSIPSKDILDIDHDWRIVTFEMELPFELIGFLATVSQELAKAGISIFVISSFSTDHILVKDNQLQDTINVLDNLGLSNS